MIIYKKATYNLTIQEFIDEFGLHKEFEKTFGCKLKDWDDDLYDVDVIETLLEKYRPENDYVLLIDDSVYTQIIEI